MNGWLTGAVPAGEPYRMPCFIRPSLLTDESCRKPSGEHTALGWAICDECYAAISDETVDRTVRPVTVLGGFK